MREFTEGELSSMFSLTNILFFLSMLCLLGALIATGVLIYQSVKNRQNADWSKKNGGDVEMAKVGGGSNDKHMQLTDE